MKKIILLLSAVILLAACSKKQDAVVKPPLTPLNATAADLAGKWLLVADTTYTSTNGKTTTTVNTSGLGGIYFQFNTDGTGSENITATSIPFTYKLSSGIILLHAPATQNSAAEDNSFTISMITTTKLAFRGVTTDGTTALAFIKN